LLNFRPSPHHPTRKIINVYWAFKRDSIDNLSLFGLTRLNPLTEDFTEGFSGGFPESF
jgi:hypothetical protein